MNSLWLQITGGQGPVECAWAVVQVLEEVRAEPAAMRLTADIIEYQPGPQRATAQSVLISLSGPEVAAFAAAWRGTVQWISQSPFRPEQKRKNWFVGIEVLEPVADSFFVCRM